MRRLLIRRRSKSSRNLAGPYFFLGVIAFGAHDYVTALRDLQRAESMQESNVLIHSYLGYTQYARSSFRDAAGLEKAVALDATDIDVLYHLSKSYGHLAKDSFADYRNILEFGLYHLAHAHAYETKENWKAASEQYSLASRKAPGQSAPTEEIGMDRRQGRGWVIR